MWGRLMNGCDDVQRVGGVPSEGEVKMGFIDVLDSPNSGACKNCIEVTHSFDGPR